MFAISVIITVYNRKSMAEEAIKSVLAQSFRDYEIILADDGSTDEIDKTAAEYPVKYLKLKHSGISAARNAGFAESSGRYVCFLDSDDLWLKNKLAVQYEFMEKHPEFPLCYTDETWIKNGKKMNQKKAHSKSGGDIFEKCLKLCIISPSSAMFRREVLEEMKFDEKLPVCEDYDLWLRISKDREIGYIPRKLIIKRGGHPDQLSAQYPAMDRFRITALRKLLKNGLAGEKREAAEKVLREKCMIVRNGALKRGKFLRALRYGVLTRRSAGGV